MAGDKVIRPVDVIGRLPEEAAAALALQHDHSVSIVRIGALTFDNLDLAEVMAPTSLERQQSQNCAGLVLFFNRHSIAEDQNKVADMQDHHDLSALVRLFAKGCVIQHGRLVLYVGTFTDPTRTKVKWISLPTDIEKWFGSRDSQLLQKFEEKLEEILERP
jgi:hypothetical protein